MIVAGIFLFVAGNILYLDLRNINSLKPAYAMIAVGVFVVAFFSISAILNKMRQAKSYFSVRMLKLNTIYTKYLNSMFMVGVIFPIAFVSFLYIIPNAAVSYAEGMKKKPVQKYDMVYMTAEKNINAMTSIAKQYDGKVNVLPMVRMTVENDEECIGLPYDAYTKLTGRKLNVKNDEYIIAVESASRDRRSVSGAVSSYAHKLHPGRSGSSLQDSWETHKKVEVVTDSVIGKYSTFMHIYSGSTMFTLSIVFLGFMTDYRKLTKKANFTICLELNLRIARKFSGMRSERAA